VPAAEVVRPWREELSQRVENFRRRRARLRKSADVNPDLDFAAGSGDADTTPDTEEVNSPEGELQLDFTLQDPSSHEVDVPLLDAVPLEEMQAESEASSFRQDKESQLSLEDTTVESPPAEIVLESSPPAARSVTSPAVFRVRPAALRRRFAAGLADLLVLLSSAGLFALVFWKAGNRLSLEPLSLLVLGFIVAFFILVYFGVFTALTASTPGLLWMGIEVRNLKGDQPNVRQASWRAFGYLVSICGLMLGFIWALVDSDGLTWHDRISGTLLSITERDKQQRE
jgi:uncharacterized RDD family membrane protein YckC